MGRCKARSLLRPETGASGGVVQGAHAVDMQVIPVGPTLGPMTTDEYGAQVRIDEQRIDQLMRWHGTDEGHLPPAHTLENLSRDTLVALNELREARATIEQLRAAMGRAFWATKFRDVHAVLLEALGPPPEDPPSADSTRGT